MEMTMINQGRTAEIFDLGDDRILKLFRKDFPMPAIENESRIADAIKDCNIPMPKFFGRMEHQNRAGLVYEYIDGASMFKSIMDKPWTLFSYAKKMAEAHAAIHQTKIEGVPMQKEQLELFINRVDMLSVDQKTKVIAELNKLPNGHSLCHGDLHPDNILFASNKPYIIDWMTATAGEAAGDVARTVILLKLGKIPSHFPLITRIMANTFKSLLCAAYTHYYLRITGMDRLEIRRWELPVAAARLFEGVPQEEKDGLLRFVIKRLAENK